MGKEKDTIQVCVAVQGDAVVGNEGYMAVRGEAVVAFYLDGWGETGRAYPVASASSVFINGEVKDCPYLMINNGEENSETTQIYFPEFEGWDVHSVSGGKTMSICLVKEK